MSKNNRKYDLKDRLIDFAIRIMHVSESPGLFQEKH